MLIEIHLKENEAIQAPEDLILSLYKIVLNLEDDLNVWVKYQNGKQVEVVKIDKEVFRLVKEYNQVFD